MIRFEEPFGLTLVEAMACGTPVVAINKGSVPEIVVDGLNGYKVKDVAEAAESISKIEKIDRKDCRKSVEEKFTTEKMVDGYEKVYQRILNQHGNKI
jgi:glycosyltransferase involved in cell wall biosynthesis